MIENLVSIIVPVYNASTYIATCVESLLIQTYKNIEIILFDDGSTDDSLAKCRQFSEQDNRIKVFTQANKGVAQTRLNAFDNSNGEFITFVDSDDYVANNYVENMLSHLKNENVDMVSSQVVIVKEGKEKKVVRYVEGRFDKKGIKRILRRFYLCDKRTLTTGITTYLCTKLIKREFVREALVAGLNLWYGEDQVGVTKLLYSIDSLYVSQDYTYYYTMNSSQATKKYDASLWQSMISCWQRQIDIDKNRILSKQLAYRMMLNINNALFAKYAYKLTNYNEFKNQISLVRENETLSVLFDKKHLHITRKIDCVFYLLKRRHYRLLYCILRLKGLKK